MDSVFPNAFIYCFISTLEDREDIISFITGAVMRSEGSGEMHISPRCICVSCKSILKDAQKNKLNSHMKKVGKLKSWYVMSWFNLLHTACTKTTKRKFQHLDHSQVGRVK